MLFVPEHTHIPVSRKTPFPSGGELPKRYAHTHDPFVALSFAAAATTKADARHRHLRSFPSATRSSPRNASPASTSLSGGRFIFGIGGGWNVEEMENHGARYNTRFKLMRERILAMKALWTEEEAEYHGEMVEFRQGLVVAEAAAEAAPADHPRRRDRLHAAPRRRILRRLVPAPRPRV